MKNELKFLLRNKKTILIVVLTILATIVVFFAVNKKDSSLVSGPTPTPLVSSTSSYNPPKAIQYDDSTDLKNELDSVDPQVLDSDFESI